MQCNAKQPPVCLIKRDLLAVLPPHNAGGCCPHCRCSPIFSCRSYGRAGTLCTTPAPASGIGSAMPKRTTDGMLKLSLTSLLPLRMKDTARWLRKDLVMPNLKSCTGSLRSCCCGCWLWCCCCTSDAENALFGHLNPAMRKAATHMESSGRTGLFGLAS